jgi:uncharacterized protein (TIGR03435 family)
MTDVLYAMNNRAAFAAALAFGIAGGAHAQEPAPAFEVATVRPSSAAGAPMAINRLPGGRLVLSNTPLPMLIRWAYDLDEARLFNVPKGFDTLEFDIVAKSPEPEPIPGRMQLMMRTLLAERFKLSIHHELRELVAYTLTTEPGGPKVVVLKSGETAGPNPFRMTDAGTLIGTRVTADMLAKVLAGQLGRPVRDMTGFSGVFDFALRWAPDTAAAATPETRDRPSLLTAVREQLGFRLEAQRTPTDVVVIDHLEKTPSEN